MMDGSRFDQFSRALTGSRRSVLGGTLALAAGWLGASRVEAKKKHKKRKPKAKPNEFGCLEVGDGCKNADQCCSGVCDGKKCRAHDVGTCEQKRPGYCAEGNPYLALCNGGSNGVCFRTTAGSNVCANDFVCADCLRDADCEALGYAQGSACAPVGGDLSCADLCENGMACVIPVGAETPEA